MHPPQLELQVPIRRQSDLATAAHGQLLKAARPAQPSLSRRLTRALGAQLVRLGIWLQAAGTMSAADNSASDIVPATIQRITSEAGA